ncbi:hypothetical protein ACH4FX_22760 [Streptomyces sp. NPDC018019]|uniref:hypothetical protein n=1 Tax=Streptomyces sp. NPDC018019 TaxID=3365030 RepID=UPI0037968BFA
MPVIDTAADTLVHTIATTAAPSPVHVASGGLLLVGQWHMSGEGGFRCERGLLSVYDCITFALLGGEAGRGAINIISTPDGDAGFVSNLQAGTVDVIDIASCQVTSVLEVAPGHAAASCPIRGPTARPPSLPSADFVCVVSLGKVRSR